jgi:ribosomal protein L12E/L44/L45/RPP1/RPP2
MVEVMSLSPFDKRLLGEGLAYFSRPRLATLLEMLGTSELERIDVLVMMLRNSSPDEFEEAIEIFERAAARAARQRTRDDARDRDHDRDSDATEESRRRRYSASAERRAQRRRSH